MKKVGIGIIGAGSISELYLPNFGARYGNLDPVFIADLFVDRAEAAARQYNIPKFGTVDELLACPEVEIVLNLTNPPAHKEINIKSLEAGKHVYCEKTFAMNLEDAKEIMALAERKGLRLACAPDTFLGAAWQTGRKLLDDGWIGKPLAINACWCSRGHENWHPNPSVSYQKGVGPLMDNGIYAVQQMLALIGPIAEVCCRAKKTFPKRTITSQPLRGEEFDVNVNTHYDCMFSFRNGCTATATFSFEEWFTYQPYFEVHGTEGSMYYPTSCDFYNGPVRIIRGEQMLDAIEGLPTHEGATIYMSSAIGPKLSREFNGPFHSTDNDKENMRSLGLSDLADAVLKGTPHRVNAQMGYHCLEVLLALEKSASLGGCPVQIESTCERPAPIPVGGLVK